MKYLVKLAIVAFAAGLAVSCSSAKKPNPTIQNGINPDYSGSYNQNVGTMEEIAKKQEEDKRNSQAQIDQLRNELKSARDQLTKVTGGQNPTTLEGLGNLAKEFKVVEESTAKSSQFIDGFKSDYEKTKEAIAKLTKMLSPGSGLEQFVDKRIANGACWRYGSSKDESDLFEIAKLVGPEIADKIRNQIKPQVTSRPALDLDKAPPKRVVDRRPPKTEKPANTEESVVESNSSDTDTSEIELPDFEDFVEEHASVTPSSDLKEADSAEELAADPEIDPEVQDLLNQESFAE